MTRLLVALIVLVLTGCAPSDRELLAGPNAVQHLAGGRPGGIPPELAELKAVAPLPPGEYAFLSQSIWIAGRNTPVG
jgi:hypothetical protein